MPSVHRRRGWEISEREVTPEHVFMNRRQILQALGIEFGLGLIGTAGQCRKVIRTYALWHQRLDETHPFDPLQTATGSARECTQRNDAEQAVQPAQILVWIFGEIDVSGYIFQCFEQFPPPPHDPPLTIAMAQGQRHQGHAQQRQQPPARRWRPPTRVSGGMDIAQLGK